jgi:hypothetical protein
MRIVTGASPLGHVVSDVRSRMRPAIIDETGVGPITEWEEVTADELLSLPTYDLRQASTEQLRAINARLGHCHDNAFRYTQAHPAASQLMGWWLFPDCLAIHSVVIEGGALINMTPPATRPLLFIHDPWLGMDSRGGKNPTPYFRKGMSFSKPIVRIPQRFDRPFPVSKFLRPDRAADHPDIATWRSLPDRGPAQAGT